MHSHTSKDFLATVFLFHSTFLSETPVACVLSLLRRKSCITLNWKVLERNRSKGGQKRPIMRKKKKHLEDFFFSNCTQLLNIRGVVFSYFYFFCFVFWHVARYNREKQLHQKYQRDCFQVNWKFYKSHSLFNLCDTAAQDALVVAQDTGQRSEKSGLFQPNRAVGNYTRRC